MSDDHNLFQRGGVWYTRVWIGGRDVRRSLRTRDKRIVFRKRDKVLEEAERIRRGDVRHPWKEAYVGWTECPPGDVGATSLKRYRVSLRQLRPYLDGLYVDEITRGKIAEIVIARRKHGVTNATIRRDLTALSSVLEYCESREWLERNAAREYFRFVKEKTLARALPAPDIIDAVVARAPGNFARLIRFAQYTGMRQEEIASLERPQIRGDKCDLWKTKTNRPRVVPLDERALGTLSGTVEHYKSPVVFHHDGKRYLNVASRFRMLAKAVGATFTFHDLRHWYAVDYLRAGGNIYDLKWILGHTSIKTTERYLVYLSPDEQEQAKYGTAHNPAQG